MFQPPTSPSSSQPPRQPPLEADYPDTMPLHEDSFLLELEAFNKTFCLHMHPNYDLLHPDAKSVHSYGDDSDSGDAHGDAHGDRSANKNLYQNGSDSLSALFKRSAASLLRRTTGSSGAALIEKPLTVKAYRGFVVDVLDHHSQDEFADVDYRCAWSASEPRYENYADTYGWARLVVKEGMYVVRFLEAERREREWGIFLSFTPDDPLSPLELSTSFQ